MWWWDCENLYSFSSPTNLCTSPSLDLLHQITNMIIVTCWHSDRWTMANRYLLPNTSSFGKYDGKSAYEKNETINERRSYLYLFLSLLLCEWRWWWWDWCLRHFYSESLITKEQMTTAEGEEEAACSRYNHHRSVWDWYCSWCVFWWRAVGERTKVKSTCAMSLHFSHQPGNTATSSSTTMHYYLCYLPNEPTSTK